MAAGNMTPLGGIFTTVQQDGEDVETVFSGPEDEEDLDKTLAVERFGDLIGKSVLRDQEKQGRSYSESDFEFHRQTSHHIHHPLSTHLPPPHKSQKRLLHSDRKKKKKRKSRKTSIPPSNVTPTIQEEEEEEEEEAESEGDEVLEKESSAESDLEASSKGESHHGKPKGDLTEGSVEFTIGSEEEEEEQEGEEEEEEEAHDSQCNLSFHVAEECSHLPPLPCLSNLLPEKESTSPRSFSGYRDNISRGWDKRKPWNQVPSGQRSNYDLKERVCIGSMTAVESATYQRIPTDEAEAQMLASADLDDMKSHRFEDNPGVRRHLVKKPSRNQTTRSSKKSLSSQSVKKKKKKKKLDRKPHEVFVELNELVVDKNQDMHWKETARWIKFEENVEEAVYLTVVDERGILPYVIRKVYA